MKLKHYLMLVLPLVILCIWAGVSYKKNQPPLVDIKYSEVSENLESSEATLQKESLVDIFDRCTKEFTKEQYQRVLCLFPYFEAMTAESGAEVALARAKELKEAKEINDCHLPSHQIGGANLKRYNNDLGQAFATCPLGCFEGCFHGAFEAYAEHVGDIESLVTSGEVPKICETVGTNRKLMLHCVHGIGHGLMRHHKTNQMIEKLDICHRISNTDYRTGCLSGVMMENVNTYLELKEGELRTAIPKICEPIQNSDKYKDLLWLCAQEISGGLIAYTGDDLVRAKDLCAVLEGELKERCIVGLTESRKTFDEEPHMER